jgi:hypothetical protein
VTKFSTLIKEATSNMGELNFNHELSVFEENEDPLQNSLHLEDLQSLMSPNFGDSDHSNTDIIEHVFFKTSIWRMNPKNKTPKPSEIVDGHDDHDDHNADNGISAGPHSLSKALPSNVNIEIENISTTSITSQDYSTSDTGSRSSNIEEESNTRPRSQRHTADFSACKQHYMDMNYLFHTKKQDSDRMGSCTYTIPHIQSSTSGETDPISSRKNIKATTGITELPKEENNHTITSKRHHTANPTEHDDKSCLSSSSALSSRISKILQPKWFRRRQDKKRQKKHAILEARKAKLVLEKCATQDDDESIATALSMRHIHDTPVGPLVIENMESLEIFSLNRDSFSRPQSVVSKKRTRASLASANPKYAEKSKVIVIKPKPMHKRSQSDSLAVMKSSEATRSEQLLVRSQSDSSGEIKIITSSSLNGCTPATHNRRLQLDYCTISVSPRREDSKSGKAKVTKPRPMHRRTQSDSPVIMGSSNRADDKYGRFSTPEKRRKYHNSYVSHLLNTPTSIIASTTMPSPSSRSLSSTLQSPCSSISSDHQSDSSSVASGVSLADSCTSVYSALSNLSYKDSGRTKVTKPRPMHQRSQSDYCTISVSPREDSKSGKAKVTKPRPMHRRTQSDSPVIMGSSNRADDKYGKFSTPEKRKKHHNSYVSHLLNTPTSIIASTTMPSPSSRSLSSTLQSPCSSISSDHQSDSSSVASGVSLADSCTSVYSALSNLSYKDPFAKPSKILKKSNLKVCSDGDGDIWVEKVFVSKRTGSRRIFFVSVGTGRRSRDEPPTGASKIIYQEDLKQLLRIEREEEQLAQQQSKIQKSPLSIGGLTWI